MGQQIKQLDVDTDLTGAWDDVLAKTNRHVDQPFEGCYVVYVRAELVAAVNGRALTGNDKSTQKKVEGLWAHLLNHVDPFKSLNATRMLKKVEVKALANLDAFKAGTEEADVKFCSGIPDKADRIAAGRAKAEAQLEKLHKLGFSESVPSKAAGPVEKALAAAGFKF